VPNNAALLSGRCIGQGEMPMRRLLVILALASALGGAAVALALPQAACAMGLCPSTSCMTSANCVGGCVCLKQGLGQGTCVSID
jgi:hypothetical protein